jgi:hypothetical protein
MKQRKILNKQSEVRPSPEGYGSIDAENGKRAYVAPQVNLHYVELEAGCMAVASIQSSATPQITDWETGTSGSGDIAIN